MRERPFPTLHRSNFKHGDNTKVWWQQRDHNRSVQRLAFRPDGSRRDCCPHDRKVRANRRRQSKILSSTGAVDRRVSIGSTDQLAKAPRCLAKTRMGTECQSPAVRGRNRCRMHGGTNPGAPRGNRNAWKHGARSMKAENAARYLKAMAKLVRDLA